MEGKGNITGSSTGSKCEDEYIHLHRSATDDGGRQVRKKDGPAQKDIVLALAPFVCIETKLNEKGKNVEYVVRECPNKKYCKNKNGRIKYQNKAGYKNPHSHLRSCLANGDDDALQKIYERTLNRKTLQSKMSPHLNSSEILFAPSQKDVEMFEFISMIVRKNLPLSIVEDEDYR